MRTKPNIENFGVSTSLCTREFSRFAKKKDLAEAYLRILQDFTEFVIKNDFEMIEIEVISAIGADLLFPRISEIKTRISRFRTVSYHLPLGEINTSALHPGIRKEAIKETKKQIDLCCELGIDKLIMHPGCFASMPDRYLLLEDRTREVAKESVFEIFDYCSQKEMELSVENLHRNEPLFQKPEEFEAFVEAGLGMVLDTVHAFVCDVEPVDFIRKLGKGITEVHLTDGVKGNPISHYAVGAGEVDCLAVLRKLEEIGFGGRIVLEVESKEDLVKSKGFLEQNGYL